MIAHAHFSSSFFFLSNRVDQYILPDSEFREDGKIDKDKKLQLLKKRYDVEGIFFFFFFLFFLFFFFSFFLCLPRTHFTDARS